MENIEQVVATPERVFFVKCRPQNADIIDIVRSEGRVFIGYPPWRRNAAYDPANIPACVVGDGKCWIGEIDSKVELKVSLQAAQC